MTGHRAVRLTPALIAKLVPALDAVADALHGALARLPPDARPEPWLLTALATGADQIAADSARRAGFRVRAMLPFAAEAYRQDFTAGAERAAFDRQLAAADAVKALPCPRDGSAMGYVTVGTAIVSACDLMLAAWDGCDEEREPGGTAHVVALARTAGVPVIHVVVDRAAGAIGPVVLLADGAGAGRRPLPPEDAAGYDALLRRVLTSRRRDPG